MAYFTIPGIDITAITTAVPARKVHNLDIDLMDDAEKKTFVRKVGIKTRRVAPEGLCASDLCLVAARHILSQIDCKATDIGAVVFVTQTPDYPIPGNSMLVQHKLELPMTTLLLDINQGCAGYVYGLSTLAGLMNTAGINKGLLLVGDTITRLLSPEDKSTLPIFSDAGSATLLEKSANGKSMHFNLGADGRGAEVISVRDGGSRYPFNSKSMEMAYIGPGISRAPAHLRMQGIDVLHYSFRYVVPNIMELLNKTNFTKDQIDYFVFHQANRILNDSLVKKLNIDPVKAPETLSKFGNTSSTTIPLTICHRLGNPIRESSKTLLLSGFGMGFSWGSVILEMGSIDCIDLLEIE